MRGLTGLARLSGLVANLTAGGGETPAAPPVNTVAPVISGTAETGQTLTASDGTWTGSPAPSFTKQWKRNGVDIPGETGNTYLLVGADSGQSITCAVTGTNASGSATANSNAVVVYEPETNAYTSRMTTPPTDTRKGLLNTLIKALKDAGVWVKRDVIYLFASHDEQSGRLNLKSSSFTVTPVNAPTFTADRGYQGNGTTSYLSTNYNPATDAVTHQQNSASIGAWINAVVSDVLGQAASWGRTTSVTTFIRHRTTGDVLGGRVNASAATGSFGAVVTRLGWRLLSRTASNVVKGYVNGAVSGGTDATASVALVSETMLIGRIQTTYSSDRWAAAVLGGGLSDAEELAEYNAINTYLTAIGAN